MVAARYPQGKSYVVEPLRMATARAALARPWWRRLGGGGGVEFGPIPEGGVQMLWANMLLHMAADPQSLIAHRGRQRPIIDNVGPGGVYQDGARLEPA